MYRVCAADRVGSDLRKSDVFDIARLDHLGDGTNVVFDRHMRIEPRRTIDVDIVGPQTAKAIGQEILHSARTRVVEAESPRGIAERTKLAADLHAIARTAAQ